MIYKILQNIFYTFCSFLKTSPYCRVKHKSLKYCNCSTIPWWQSCQLHYI